MLFFRPSTGEDEGMFGASARAAATGGGRGACADWLEEEELEPEGDALFAMR